MKKIILLVIIMLSVLLWSAELEVNAYVNRSTVGVNDVLQYTIEISGSDADKIGTPSLPELTGFDQRGVSTSSSSSYTMVNGKFESSVTKKYQYTLVPQNPGKIDIPSITIKYKNQSYKTKAIPINVVPGSNEPAPTQSSPTSPSRTNTNTSEKLSDNLFIEAEISNRNPYRNEPIELTYTIYSKYSVTSLAFDEEPSFMGFWKEDVFTPSRINFRRVNRDGEIFNAMTLKTYALFPSQTGRVVIDALKMNVDIRTESRSFFDFGSSKKYLIHSKPLTLNVRDLPEESPKSFSGAVGNFRLNSSISSRSMKVGDSFTYTLEISGRGNFNNLEIATLPKINHLRFLDPETSTDINNTRINGKKIIRYLVIAQEPGEFTIPSLAFSFFDPDKGRYITLRSDRYDISVQEGSSVFIPGSASQSSIFLEGSDIGFIIDTDSIESYVPWFDSILYWLVLLISFLALPLTTIIAKRQSQIATNIDYQRQRRAQKVLKKYLKLATQHHKNSNSDFYFAAQSGLVNYLTDKLKIAHGSRTDDIIKKAKSAGIDQQLVADINTMFNRCNEARFMPGGFSSENINADYNFLREIVASLAKTRIMGN
jgi:hypothetical protein